MLVGMGRGCKLLSSDERKLKAKGSNWAQRAAEGEGTERVEIRDQK